MKMFSTLQHVLSQFDWLVLENSNQSYPPIPVN